MKKTLLLCMAIIGIWNTSAQSVGIIGTATPGGWDFDTDMSTTDNIIYTLNDQVLTAGYVKFRQDNTWDINWGGSAFPSGTGTQGGSDITIPANTYDITFNRLTGAYSFVSATTYPAIGIWGLCVDAVNGFGGPDVKMFTGDGVNYKLSAHYFSSGSGNFRQDDNPSLTYSSTGYPSGIAVPSGPNFFVTGGQHTVYYNRNTGAYSFNFPSVGIIGSAVNGAWSVDLDMTTTDGENYSLTLPLSVGELKFRLDDDWTVNWGNTTFPDGFGTQGGPDLAIASAANYNVTFNRLTGAYHFEITLASDTFTRQSFGVHPNPAATNWNFNSNATIENIQVYDLAGAKVFEGHPNAAQCDVDGSKFAPGIYFAKLSGAHSVKTVKLIKR